jgi:hypothetical protein
MSRNSSGTYSPPAGQPAVSGTAISSTAHNALVSDLSTEVTDSLSRSGKGAMLAPLRVPDGTVAAPAVAFSAEPGSGVYRAGAGDVRVARLGVDQVQVAAGGVTVQVPLVAADGETVPSGDVELTQAAAQAVRKTGGNLTVGTGDANHLFLATNGVTRFTVNSTGDLGSSGGKITGLPTPTLPADAVPKDYVDGRTAFSMLTADASESAGTLANLTGLSFAIEASAVYEFEFVLVDETAAATTAIWYALAGPSTGLPSATYTQTWIDSNTLPVSLSAYPGSGFNNTVTQPTGHASGRSITRICGVVVNGTAAGTVQAQFRTEVAGSAATVRRGSFVRYRKIG